MRFEESCHHVADQAQLCFLSSDESVETVESMFRSDNELGRIDKPKLSSDQTEVLVMTNVIIEAMGFPPLKEQAQKL